MTGDVTIKTNDGEIYRIPTQEVKILKMPDPRVKSEEQKELEKIKDQIER